MSSTSSFEQYGDKFWDKQGPYRSLHHINPARLKYITQHINPHGKTILDIGCGGGILAEALAQQGAIVSGIDISPSVLRAAREHATISGANINYREISTSDCVKNSEQYDHITCMEMLEHVANPAAVLRDIYALLKPQGYAFLSTLNRTTKSFLGAIVAAEYVMRLVPKGTHHHEHFIRPNELVNMAEHIGFTVVDLMGMDYHPFLKIAFLSRKLDINYLITLQKK